ncbi:hypothetical protein [Streptomyces sp. N2A]|uniref:hypothetical protein n=1 Tax=Streptomyces sp. N2A TaxID=3073936 RepID=UPI00286FB0B8|nr:hypothetical protein [Streptomyces sp. N2A]
MVVASGLSWRRLDDDTKANELIGRGVYYQALVTDAEYFKNKEIVVVGGGNSARAGHRPLRQLRLEDPRDPPARTQQEDVRVPGHPDQKA